jgi:DNA polymerase-1
MFGRRRDLPTVYSGFYGDRQSAKRKAFNTPIQSGATGVIKRAMRYVWNMLSMAPEYKEVCKPVLMIHDELCFYIRQDMLLGIASNLKAIMENAVQLTCEHGQIPVVCDVEISEHDWHDCKEVDWSEFKRRYNGNISETINKIKEN